MASQKAKPTQPDMTKTFQTKLLMQTTLRVPAPKDLQTTHWDPALITMIEYIFFLFSTINIQKGSGVRACFNHCSNALGIKLAQTCVCLSTSTYSLFQVVYFQSRLGQSEQFISPTCPLWDVGPKTDQCHLSLRILPHLFCFDVFFLGFLECVDTVRGELPVAV